MFLLHVPHIQPERLAHEALERAENIGARGIWAGSKLIDKVIGWDDIPPSTTVVDDTLRNVCETLSADRREAFQTFLRDLHVIADSSELHNDKH